VVPNCRSVRIRFNVLHNSFKCHILMILMILCIFLTFKIIYSIDLAMVLKNLLGILLFSYL
jgi:hypothetical protein